MKTKTITIVLVFLLIFSLTACDSGTENSSVDAKQIKDCAGRTVKIPERPKRVACLYASTAHMMAMLGEGDKIVGAPNGVKSDVLMQMKYPDMIKTATPYQEGSINVEELMRIKTDLALIRYSTGANQGEVEKLDKLGIPYVVVDYTDMEELETAIGVMGQVFGKEEQAGDYIQFSKETVALVQKQLGDIPQKKWPSVYHSVNEAIRTDGAGDICGEIMNLAAVRNIAIEKGVKSGGDKTYTTLEEIYKWSPDAFIANEYAVTDYILSDSKWNGLDAVKQKNVFTLPVGATRWCHPGSMEAHMGVLAVAQRFYPERFKNINMEQYVSDYYKTYFDLKLDEQTVKKILSGEGMRISNSPTE